MDNEYILKSYNDTCEYYTYTIPNNKLNVFIVNDVNANISCVVMSVKIGHMYDTIPGIAHFLEHMLFNGTEKYPNENEFMTFTTKYGGYTNAFTEHNSTCYYYTIQSDHLNTSLDMFGHFFISPLFNKDSIEREKEAVNAEHMKNIYNDGWRFIEILRHACVNKHPLKKFGTGSNKTLNISDIDKHVKHFYENYYSSDLMTLFVITNNNIQDVKNTVNNIFCNIPLRINNVNRKTNFGKVLDCPKTIQVVPIENSEKIILNWEVPSYNTLPVRSPLSFLTHLLGHECKNTIHYILTQKGYISNIAVGIREYIFDVCIFYVEMTLSPSGSQHRNEIIKIVFDYIDLIAKNINNKVLEDLYNETIILDEYNFKYAEKQNPDDRGIFYHHLINRYKFNLCYLLAIPYVHDKFNNIKKNIKTVLNKMTKENCILIIGSKEYEGKTLLKDENYGTMYNITNEFIYINKYISIECIDLPCINKYISIENKLISDQYKIPKKIRNDKVITYFLPTNKFINPNINIQACIDIPLSLVNKEIYTKTILYFNSIISEINHEKYLCEIAQYDIKIIFDMGKLYISIYGNYGKINKVCKFIVNSLLNGNNISNKSFNKTKYILENSDINIKFDPPYSRLSSYLNKKLCSKFYDNYDRLSVIQYITKNNTIPIINDIFKTSLVTLLVCGNSTEKIALELGNIFEKFVPNDIYTPNISIYDIYNNPNSDNDIYIYPAENDHEINYAVGYYIFIEKIRYGITKIWDKYICLLNVLDKIISSEYFDELRIKEKFGYITNSSISNIGDKRCLLLYYKFMVQSPDKSANEIIERTNKFITDFRIKLINISDKDFSEIIIACISTLLSDFNNLEELSDFIQLEIESNYLTFNLKETLINTYKLLNINDLITFYDNKFINRKSIIIGLNKN